jgi:tetraacyldisaccharide 4'-kinase
VGGTGKSPHVEYLVRLLKDSYQTTTLSRGYGRQTKGFLLANAQSTALELGDEPMQFYHKFSNQIAVAVGEKRALAIPQLLSILPQTQVIILDDAFQHRAVKPSLSILLTDYNKPFYNDLVLPSGRLRERRIGAIRADIIIMSKCPNSLTKTEQETIIQQIKPYIQANAPVYFTGIQYGEPIAFGKKESLLSSQVLLVSGLANSRTLEKYVEEQFQLCYHLAFKDHHQYSKNDLILIKNNLNKFQAKAVLVTEKDYVKLMHPSFANIVSQVPFYYLPIEVCFLFGGKEVFNQKVLRSIMQHLN